MVVLVDTNVVVDVLAKREPYAEEAQKILEKCAKHEMKGWLAAHTISNLFYILRKDYSQSERRRFIKDLCEIFDISTLDEQKILSAAENEEFIDFEDCLQEVCAYEESADYIVTRNPSDFSSSRVSVIQPGDLLALLSDGKE